MLGVVSELCGLHAQVMSSAELGSAILAPSRGAVPDPDEARLEVIRRCSPEDADRIGSAEPSRSVLGGSLDLIWA